MGVLPPQLENVTRADLFYIQVNSHWIIYIDTQTDSRLAGPEQREFGFLSGLSSVNSNSQKSFNLLREEGSILRADCCRISSLHRDHQSIEHCAGLLNQTHLREVTDGMYELKVKIMNKQT